MWEIKPRLVQLPLRVSLEPHLEYQGLNHPALTDAKPQKTDSRQNTHTAEYRHSTGLGVQGREKEWAFGSLEECPIPLKDS